MSPECACLSVGIIRILITFFRMSTVVICPCWRSDSLSSRTLNELNSNSRWNRLSCGESAYNHLFHAARFAQLIDKIHLVCLCV